MSFIRLSLLDSQESGFQAIFIFVCNLVIYNLDNPGHLNNFVIQTDNFVVDERRISG